MSAAAESICVSVIQSAIQQAALGIVYMHLYFYNKGELC